MKHIGLFEGIGGFSLACRWIGWETVAWCEINEFCQKILRYHFPTAEGFSDIKNTDFKKYANKIDILTGGFPCQPYSTAGKRKGKDDERHLWPEMLRAIREIRPRWVVGENVRGLTNWNGGLVFDEVQADLENEGYEVLPFLLPACGVNAPHRRDRIWFVAHAISDRHERRELGGGGQTQSQSEGQQKERERLRADIKGNGATGIIADSISIRQPKQGKPRRQMRSKEASKWEASWAKSDGTWPVESPVCDGNDGLSSRLDGITFLNWQIETLKGAGNAIVPQVALQIFKAIKRHTDTQVVPLAKLR